MLIRLGRRAYHSLRLLPERLLHPRRRRAALARQTALGRPRRVLILCHGNVCRSPYAEVKLRGLLAERGWADTLVESAGFIGPGRPANDSAQRTATARHVDLTGHRSRLVNPTMAEAASLLIVMTTAQARDANQEFGVAWTRIEILGDLDPASIGERDIPDPYGRPSEVFERVFDRIDRCLEALVGAWGP